MAPLGPYKLTTVIRKPKSSKPFIDNVIKQAASQYTLSWVGNAEALKQVKTTVTKNNPDVLFIASTWTVDESAEITKAAKEIKPDLRCMALPYGMSKEKSGAEVVAYVKAEWDAIIKELSSEVPA